VIQLSDFHQIDVVAGAKHINIVPSKPFSEMSIDFLDKLSKIIRESTESKIYGDLMVFSFWCRKGNINKLKRNQRDRNQRLGRGLAFHITPSNVPLNFGYSFIFGLLSGNSNILKIPTKEFPQAEFLCYTINDLLNKKKYKFLYDKTAFVRYDKNNHITEYFSSVCDARVIWGGDSTIKNVRQYQTPVCCIDIAFADRYSLCVINTDILLDQNSSELNNIIGRFYNDTYIMDQNACSSPHLIVWLGKKKQKAKNQFWELLDSYVRKNYNLLSVSAVDKYNRFCQNAIDINMPFKLIRHGNHIYRILLDKLPDNIHSYRGNCGYFFEYDASNLSDITHIISKKYQTLTYFGLDKLSLKNFVIDNKLNGIDRIVPIGQALDINLNWDGYDIIGTLSRYINYK
jgi:hypothetical protein